MNGKQKQPKKGRIGDRYRKIELNNENIKKKNKKEITKIAFLAVILLTIVLGTSYAFFTIFIDEGTESEIVAGTFNVKFYEGRNINLTNTSPMSDEEGLATDGYTFTIENTGTINANYNVSLEEKTATGNTLDKKYIKYSVKVGDGDWSTPRILGDNQNGMLINNGELSATPGENQVKYEIKLWLREDADNSVQGKSFSARLVVSGVQNNADRLDKIGGATPIIKLNGASVVNIKQGEEYQELGVSAVSDDKDTITVNEVEYSYTHLENNEEIETNTIDTSTTGIYYVYYKVTDSDGNIGISVRTINVVADETSSTEIPSIKLKGDSIIRVAKGSEYKEPGVTATINDKDVSNKVVTVGAVNTKVEGTYVIKYIIKTSNGNISSVTRTVIVEQIGKITMKVTEPKYVNNKAEMTITVTSDGGYVNGYAITKSEKQPTDREFEKLKEASKVTKDIKISKNGVYYIWSKDSNGNITSEKVEINKIDDEKPVCVFNDVGYAALDGTTSIELTCTDTSELKTTYLDNDNFEIIDSNKATITNISGIEEIENGFKYVVDIKGLNLGEFTIKFKANSISDIYGNKNSESTSGNIEVTDFKVDSDSINLNVTGENTHQITVTGNKGELEYSSSNTSVATVSDTGLITAVSPGSVTITVTDTLTGIKKKITVDVEKYITAQLIKQGRGVTSIADSNKEEIVEIGCKLTKSNTTSCEVLLPNISVSEGYTALGWSANSNSHDPEYKIGDKATITIDGENKFYPISKRDSITKTAIFSANGYGAVREKTYDDVSCETNEIYNDEEINDSCEITLPSITVYDGYTARGWSQNKATKEIANVTTDISAKDGYIKPGSKVMIDNLTYFYTITSKDPKELTAKYDANGASLGKIDDSNTKCTTLETWNEETPSFSCNVVVPTVMRDGFEIKGFSTDQDALKNNSVIFNEYIPITEENTGKTWYAQTEKSINITWNGNGATITSTQSGCSIINEETSCSITSPSISRNDYNIIGFSENKDDDGSNENTIWKVNTTKTFTDSDNNKYEYYAITNKELSASITYYTDDNTVKGLKNSSKNVIVKRLNTTDSNNNRVSETEKCLVSNKNTTCDITVPEVVKQSKGPSDIDYAGLAKEVNSEEDLITTDTFAITKDDDYYALYKTEVKPKFYYYNGSNVVYDDSVTGTRLAILKEKDGEYTIVQEALSVPTIVTQSKGLSDSSNYFGVSTTKSSKDLTSSVSTANEEYYTVYKEIWNVSYSKDETAIKSIGSSISTCDNYQTTDGNEYTIKGENCSVNLPAITPNPSYKSLGWYDGTTKVGNPGDSYLITGNKELIAKGEINEYTVTYDYKTNGGDSVSEVSKSTQIGSPIDLSVTATKEGWKFVGWNTDKDAHDALSNLIMPNKNITLYAIYKKSKDATFYYYDGTAQSALKTSCTLYNKDSSCKYEVPGVVTSSIGPDNAKYSGVSSSVSSTTAATLDSNNSSYYAYYLKTVTANFESTNPDVASISSSTISCDVDKITNGTTYTSTACDITLPTITVKDGYTNNGWNTDKKALTGEYNKVIKINSDTKYYTIIGKKAIILTATFNKNGAKSQTKINSQGNEEMSSDDSVTRTCTLDEIKNIVSQSQATSCNITTPDVEGMAGFNVVSPAYAKESNATIGVVDKSTTLELTKNEVYYAITKKDAVILTAGFNANGNNLSSSEQKNCILAAVYNGAKQDTSCSVTAPIITAPDNTPIIIGYSTSASSHSKDEAYNEGNNKITLTASNTNQTWYAQTKSKEITYNVKSYNVGKNVSAINEDKAKKSCTISSSYNGTKQDTSCEISGTDLPKVTAKKGYTYTGWTEDGATATNGSNVITLTKENDNKDWYSYAIGNSFKIEYHIGDNIDTQNYAVSDDGIILKTAEKQGYSFKGWAISSDASTVVYKKGEKAYIEADEGDIIKLYAVFVDDIAPVCSFSSAAATTVQNETTMTLTCTDTGSGISSKNLSAANFTTTANGIVTKVSNPTAINNGYSYIVTLKGISVGTFTVNLNEGAIGDNAGNTNVITTSSSITVIGRTYRVNFSQINDNVSGSNSSTISCTTTGSNLTCTIPIYPKIVPRTGYTATTWFDKTANKDTGVGSEGDGSKYEISQDTNMIAQDADQTAPTISVSSTPSTDWTSSDKSFTVTASDTGSGIVGYYISTSNTTPQANASGWETSTTTTKTYTKDEGTYYIWSKDAAGNVSNSVSVDVTKIDKVTPDVSATAYMSSSETTVESGNWSTEGLNFSFNRGPVGTSGYTIKYCKDTTNSCTPTTVYSSYSGSGGNGNGTSRPLSAYNSLTNNEYYIRYKIESGTGLSSEVKSFYAKVDATTPSCSITADEDPTGNNDWYIDGEDHILELSTNTAGISGMSYGFDNYKESVSSGKTGSVGTSTPVYNGIYTCSGVVKTGAGKTASCSKTMKQDNTPTEALITMKKASGASYTAGTWSSEDVILTASSDSYNDMQYQWCYYIGSCGTLSGETNNKTYTVTGTPGKYSVEITNSQTGKTASSLGKEVLVDKVTPPAPTITAKKSSAGTTIGSGTWSNEGLKFIFDIDGVNNASGATTRYCVDTSDTCIPTETVPSGGLTSYNTKTGTYYVRYKSVSGAGLSSEVKSYTAKVDTITPSVSLKATKSTSGTSVSSGSWSNEQLQFVFTKGTTGSSGYTIKYCKDTTGTCTPNTTISSGTAVNFTTRGSYYIRYNITGGSGKTSSIGSYHALVDTSGPEILSKMTSGKITVGSSITSPVGFSDVGASGLAKNGSYCYLRDSGSTSSSYNYLWNSSESWTYTGDLTKKYKLDCVSKDNAGNTTSASFSNIIFVYGTGWSKTYTSSNLSYVDGPSVSSSKIYLHKNSNASVGIQYGPYRTYSDGCYKVTYNGYNLNKTGISFDSTFGTSASRYPLFNYSISSSTAYYYIQVINTNSTNKYDSNVEHRTFTTINKTNTSYIPSSLPYLNSIKVAYVGDTSSSYCSGSSKTTIP